MGIHEQSVPPAGTTHTSEVYGHTYFYKRVTWQRLNQVSEEWQTLVAYQVWEHGKWVPVGSGFSSHRLDAYPMPHNAESNEGHKPSDPDARVSLIEESCQ